MAGLAVIKDVPGVSATWKQIGYSNAKVALTLALAPRWKSYGNFDGLQSRLIHSGPALMCQLCNRRGRQVAHL